MSWNMPPQDRPITPPRPQARKLPRAGRVGGGLVGVGGVVGWDGCSIVWWGGWFWLVYCAEVDGGCRVGAVMVDVAGVGRVPGGVVHQLGVGVPGAGSAESVVAGCNTLVVASGARVVALVRRCFGLGCRGVSVPGVGPVWRSPDRTGASGRGGRGTTTATRREPDTKHGPAGTTPTRPPRGKGEPPRQHDGNPTRTTQTGHASAPTPQDNPPHQPSHTTTTPHSHHTKATTGSFTRRRTGQDGGFAARA